MDDTFHKFPTPIRERGFLLFSHGVQPAMRVFTENRIAVAWVVVSKPKILLLDQDTSGREMQSEGGL